MLLGILGWTEFCNFSFTPSCHISLHLPLFLIFLHILLVRPAAVNNDPIYIYYIYMYYIYICLVLLQLETKAVLDTLSFSLPLIPVFPFQFSNTSKRHHQKPLPEYQYSFFQYSFLTSDWHVARKRLTRFLFSGMVGESGLF